MSPPPYSVSQPDAQRGCAERDMAHPRCASGCDFGVALTAILISGILAVGPGRAAAAEPVESAGIELFEKEIRPLLAEKCQSCHGEKKVRGGLRLNGRRGLLKGGDSGPAVVPGKPEESLLIQALGYRGDVKMPPDGKLTDAEIGKLSRWVSLGAPWPDPAKPADVGQGFAVTDAQRRWWAFAPVRAPAPPAVRDAAWAKSDIDRFVLAELERAGLAPAAPADKGTLLRRVTFDLTGLPPTPAEVEAFLRDDSPGAFAKVVDRLLASPEYGGRWARHWLDVVRYADYHDGNPQTRVASCEPMEAWRYRDWVVTAFNRDLPFDKFVVHQMAGDLLPGTGGAEADYDGLVATTFLSNGCWDRGDADKEKMVSDMVDDQIDTVGKAFLGLTLGCARCHDHKFDPVSQADYYGLAGIFYSTHILRDLGTKGGEYTLNRTPLAPPDVIARRVAALKRLETAKAKVAELEKKPRGWPAEVALRVAAIAEREVAQAELPPEPPMAEAAREGGTRGGLFPGIQDVPIHIRGSYARLGPVVPRRLPQFLAGARPPIAKGSGRRELADWIASADNPLTARVIVNRVWQWHFGAGLVRTPNNFGLTSEPPSHPALLDWLAARFVQDGWSLKKLHRLIVMSAVYQQSSRIADCGLRLADLKSETRPDPQSVDPEDRLLWRFPPRRLEAEAIRDALLAAAGRLDLTPGGPAGADLDVPRRSLYIQTARHDRGTFAILFDAANPDASTERRTVSTVAPQALFLLNHKFVADQARHFAERLAREVPADGPARVRRAYELLFARMPTEEEIAVSLAVVRSGRGASGWIDLAHVLMCSNEFVYVD